MVDQPAAVVAANLMAARFSNAAAPISGTAAFPTLPSGVQLSSAQRLCPYSSAIMAYLDIDAAARDPSARFVHTTAGSRPRSWPLADLAGSHWLTPSGVLMRATPHEFRVRGSEDPGVLCVPESMRRSVMALYHDDAAHVGTGRMLADMQRSVYWPSMAADTSKWIAECAACSSTKPSSASHRRVEGHLELPFESWEVVYLDIIGPMPSSRQGNCYGLVAVCAATRWIEVIPLARIDSASVLTALESLIWRHGSPATVWSDRGSQLLSKEASEMYAMLDINVTATSAYRHAANGVCERSIKSLKMLLSASLASQASHETWEERLPRVLFAMRTAASESLGFSPFALMYGREASSPVARSMAEYPRGRDGYAPELAERIAHMRELSRLIWSESRSRSRQAAALAPHARRLIPVYARGDYVRLAVERQARSAEVGETFLPSFTGPYFVQGPVEKRKDTYIISRTPSSVPFVVDGERLKRVPQVQRGEVPLESMVPDGVGAGRGVHLAPALPPVEIDYIMAAGDNQVEGVRGSCYLVRFAEHTLFGDRWFPRTTLVANGLLPLISAFEAAATQHSHAEPVTGAALSLPAPVVASAERDRTHDDFERPLKRGKPGDWESSCHVCGLFDADATRLLLCNYCPLAFHHACIGRRVTPLGLWRCPDCLDDDARVDDEDEVRAIPEAVTVETNVLPVAAMDVHELVEPVVPARAVRRRQKRTAVPVMVPVSVSVQRDARLARKRMRERRQLRSDTLAAVASSDSDIDECLN